MWTFSTRRRHEDQFGLGTAQAICNIPTITLKSATSVWGFCHHSENVSSYTATSFLYCSFLVFFFFFSFFISTKHLGMCQATLVAFCALFTDKNQKNGQRRGFTEDKAI